jgi:hypothetical protein
MSGMKTFDWSLEVPVRASKESCSGVGFSSAADLATSKFPDYPATPNTALLVTRAWVLSR